MESCRSESTAKMATSSLGLQPTWQNRKQKAGSAQQQRQAAPAIPAGGSSRDRKCYFLAETWPVFCRCHNGRPASLLPPSLAGIASMLAPSLLLGICYLGYACGICTHVCTACGGERCIEVGVFLYCFSPHCLSQGCSLILSPLIGLNSWPGSSKELVSASTWGYRCALPSPASMCVLRIESRCSCLQGRNSETELWLQPSEQNETLSRKVKHAGLCQQLTVLEWLS